MNQVLLKENFRPLSVTFFEPIPLLPHGVRWGLVWTERSEVVKTQFLFLVLTVRWYGYFGTIFNLKSFHRSCGCSPSRFARTWPPYGERLFGVEYQRWTSSFCGWDCSSASCLTAGGPASGFGVATRRRVARKQFSSRRKSECELCVKCSV